MPKPNTNAISRNMTRLALEVDASAFSPRKRPTQIALIEPFSDWMIEETSVGSAKASRVVPIGPMVRSRWPGRVPAGGPLAISIPRHPSEGWGPIRFGLDASLRWHTGKRDQPKRSKSARYFFAADAFSA